VQLIFFTKFLKGLSVEETGARANALGFDGLDVAIRAGYCVNPDNVTDALPAAMAVWREQNLSVPLVTLEGGATDPNVPETRAIIEACGRAGIPNVKLGYWEWRPEQRYADGVATARNALARFERIGRDCGVRILVHTHSGACYGLNASAAAQLVQGFDPRYVGVYLDPAHLKLCGEPLPMALAIAQGYLAMVAAKNARYVWDEAHARWQSDWCLLREGLVNWPEAIATLREAGYDGPISVHGEYSATEQTDAVLERVAQEVALLRGALG
jgi:sugar phosphate isomerase/epimerase